MSESDLSSSPLSQLSNYHQDRSKLISLLRHFYEKLLQIVLQSRLNTSQLQSAQDHWFNILYQYEPIKIDMSFMSQLESSLMHPIQLDIILSWKHLNDTKIYHNEIEIPKTIKSVVLETWTIECNGQTSDIDTKSVYKFLCQYFRLLVAILKRLPSHNLLKSEKSKMIKRFGWHVTFTLNSISDALPVSTLINTADTTMTYDMPSIQTQLGSINVNLKYRSPANFSMSPKSELKTVLHRKPDTIEEMHKKLDSILNTIPPLPIPNHTKEQELKVI